MFGKSSPYLSLFKKIIFFFVFSLDEFQNLLIKISVGFISSISWAIFQKRTEMFTIFSGGDHFLIASHTYIKYYHFFHQCQLIKNNGASFQSLTIDKSRFFSSLLLFLSFFFLLYVKIRYCPITDRSRRQDFTTSLILPHQNSMLQKTFLTTGQLKDIDP